MARRLVVAGILVVLLMACAPGATAQGKSACNDGNDNDGDELIDLNDPGCESKGDKDEYNAPPAAACDDGQDNDQDGKVDYPADSGCSSSQDGDETNSPPEPTQDEKPCLEGIGICLPPAGPVMLDGWIQFLCTPATPYGVVEAWQDNDGDGRIDRDSDTLLWRFERQPPDICS